MSWTLYRHYKGRDYLRLGVAVHSEDTSQLVVYRCLYGDPPSGNWVRPQAMFEGRLDDGGERFAPIARVRVVQPEDNATVLRFGYDAWSEGRTLDEFVASYEQSLNHQRGTRYLLEDLNGTPLSSLNTLRFRQGLVGIASVATTPEHRGRGHASRLVRAVMELMRSQQESVRFLLFSEVKSAFYERNGFRQLTAEYQRFLPSVAMITGDASLSAEEAVFLEKYF